METGFCFLRRHSGIPEAIHHYDWHPARCATPFVIKQFRLAAIAREINASGRPVAKPACIVCGGETTVTLRRKGKGGRNQEIALAAAIEIAGMSEVVVFSGGTDGPTDAAGAIADGETIARVGKGNRRARILRTTTRTIFSSRSAICLSPDRRGRM